MGKILYFQWNSFMNAGIERALQKMNIIYDTFCYQFADWEKDDVFCEQFEAKMKAGAYEAVFSINYAPLISTVCARHDVRYISWVYDCPIHIRDLTTLKNSCNTIYFFDRVQAEEYRSRGIDARHMPLAVDTELYRRIYETRPERAEREKYETDIALVGKLYRTEYQHYLQPLPAYQRGRLEGIIAAQLKVYGGYLIPDLVTDELLAELNDSYAKASGGKVSISRR